METEEILTGFIQLGLSAALVGLSVAVAILAVKLVNETASLCNSIHELGKEKRNSGMGRFFDRYGGGRSPVEESLKNFSAGIKEISDQVCQSLK